MNTSKKILTLADTISIPVYDNGDLMVPLIYPSIKTVYCKKDMVQLLGETMYVRQAVADKLIALQRLLDSNKKNLALLIVYGYRTPEIQQRYYEGRLLEVRKQFPKLSVNEQVERAHAMSAHPDSAGHPTGGAVDITLWDSKNNQEIDMGSQIAEFGGAEKTNYPHLSKLQRNNRLLLQDMMMQQGFAPFLGEWWHFSYGDKEWAAFYRQPNALYAAVPLEKVKIIPKPPID